MRKWLPCAAMMVVSIISYIDRSTLAILSPTILAETRLSDEQYGWIISAFSVAYMLANPLWGRLLDRLGVWIGMLAAVGMWSLASASHAFAYGFFGFAAARMFLGLGEGATFPGGLRTATQTLPPDRRARGIAIAYSGGSAGAILTPILVTPVALKYGWRTAFLLTGLLGAAWLVLWTAMRREPGVDEPPAVAPAPGDEPRTISFTDLRLWGFIALYAGGALPLGFVLYKSPLFLSQALHQTQAQLGRILWIPPLGWEVGYFFWGWVIDRITRHGRNVVGNLRVLVVILLLLGAPLALTPFLSPLSIVMAELFVAMFVTSGFILAGIAYATHCFSTRQSGFIAGVGAGSWSAMVALTMPLFGRLFDLRSYGKAFCIAALIPFVGCALWRALDHVAGSAKVE